MAEEVGFEPTVQLPAQQFSRLPHSTTLAPLRNKTIFQALYALMYHPLKQNDGIMRLKYEAL